MRISVKHPGRRATDLRTTVTLREDGTPWPISVHFVVLDDEDTGKREFRLVGFEIGEYFRTSDTGPSAHVAIEQEPEPLDLVTVQRVTGNFAAYVEFARYAIVFEEEGMASSIRLLRGPGKKPARLTDDFFRTIAADYEARRKAGERHLVKAMAEAHHVTVSAASRWISRTKELGYIDEEGPGGG